MGVTIEDDGDERKDEGAVLIWDVNAESFSAFDALRTQWRQISRGFTGALWTLGFDYAGVDAYLRRTRAPKHVFADLQEMETAALDAFHEIESEPA